MTESIKEIEEIFKYEGIEYNKYYKIQDDYKHFIGYFTKIKNEIRHFYVTMDGYFFEMYNFQLEDAYYDNVYIEKLNSIDMIVKMTFMNKFNNYLKSKNVL